MEPEIRILLCPLTMMALWSYVTEALQQQSHELINTKPTNTTTFRITFFKPIWYSLSLNCLNKALFLSFSFLFSLLLFFSLVLYSKLLSTWESIQREKELRKLAVFVFFLYFYCSFFSFSFLGRENVRNLQRRSKSVWLIGWIEISGVAKIDAFKYKGKWRGDLLWTHFGITFIILKWCFVHFWEETIFFMYYECHALLPKLLGRNNLYLKNCVNVYHMLIIYL